MKRRPARPPRPRARQIESANADVASAIMHELAEMLRNFKGRVIAAAATLDLTPPQADLLRRLAPSQPIPMGALAGMLACDASNVTGLVDRLEARGLIERLSQPNDRRVKAIALTREGVAARDRFLDVICEVPASLARATARDLGQAAAVLAALNAALRDPDAAHATFAIEPARPARPSRPLGRRPRVAVPR